MSEEKQIKEWEKEGWKKVGEADLFEFKETGDHITGQLIHTETEVGVHKSKMHSLKQSDGNIKKVWGSKILDERLMGITFGTTITIVYKGEVKPDKGNAYHDFEIYQQTKREA